MTTGETQRLRDSALSALALHRDGSVDALLDRHASEDLDTNARRLARSLLGSARGAHGFETLRRLLDAERLPDMRRQLVTSIGQTRQPGTADLLLKIATSDSDAKVRGEAAYWLPQRGGAPVVPRVLAIVEADASDSVKQRAVQGLARLPAGDSTTLLIDFARNSTNTAVKKEAVSALGRSNDPKALAYVESLLR
jgi:HEAT repeat protein